VKLTQVKGSCIVVTIRATQTPPQHLSSLELTVRELDITRESAALIMGAPKFTNFNVYEVQGRGIFNQAFDGLSAPNLEKFSSTGSPRYPHDYDLDAPQLQRIAHYNNGCLPKSAAKCPRLTYLYTEHFNPNQYEHLRQLAEMTVITASVSINGWPANLKKLKLIDWYSNGGVHIEKLPDRLEVLDTSNIIYNQINLLCILPKTLHTWMVTNHNSYPVLNLPEEWKNISGRTVCEYNVLWPRPRYANKQWVAPTNLKYTIKTRALATQ
jgi:hypothetical protein